MTQKALIAPIFPLLEYISDYMGFTPPDSYYEEIIRTNNIDFTSYTNTEKDNEYYRPKIMDLIAMDLTNLCWPTYFDSDKYAAKFMNLIFDEVEKRGWKVNTN